MSAFNEITGPLALAALVVREVFQFLKTRNGNSTESIKELVIRLEERQKTEAIVLERLRFWHAHTRNNERTADIGNVMDQVERILRIGKSD